MMTRMLSLCLLLSIPRAALLAQEAAAEVLTTQDDVAQVATETTVQEVTVSEENMKRVNELLPAYNPQLFAVAEKMVANVEAYRELVNRVQELFPRFTMGYVFTIDAHDMGAAKVDSEMICSLKHAQAEEKNAYKMDELAHLDAFGMSKLEIALLKDFVKAAQINFDRQVAATIVQHEELAHLVTESKLSLNQFINLANSEVLAPVAQAESTEAPATTEIPAAVDAASTQHEEVHAEA